MLFRTGVRASIGALLLGVWVHAAAAQTTGSVSPTTDPEPSVGTEPPPGGCMPIGVTASGDIVFPFQCKGFIEQHRLGNEKPDPPQPSLEANTARPDTPVTPKAIPDAKGNDAASRPPEEVNRPLSSGAEQPVETAPPPAPRRLKKGREGEIGPPGCGHFRSYDPTSGTYTDLNHRRRLCRS